MAPSFLSKLVKVATPNHNGRDRLSSESPRPSGSSFSINSTRNRSQSASINNSSGSNAIISPSTPTQKAINNNNNSSLNIPTLVTNFSADNSRRSSVDTVSTQPNVTIVPPSPLVGNAELDSDDEEEEEDLSPVVRPRGSVRADTQKTITPATADEPEDVATPTLPTPNMSSTTNGSLAPGTYLKKQASNKSIGKKSPPTELQIDTPPVNHTRAATAPAETTSASASAASEQNMNAIVESPTDLSFPANPVIESPTNAPIHRENTAASIFGGAPDNSKQTKRRWTRSATRKPTGLASAIAASGLAMANPAASISPPPVLSAGSSRSTGSSMNPYMSKSPAQSSASHHGKARSADLSPRSTKSRKSSGGSTSGGRSRRPSAATSARSDGGSEYYASPSAVGTSTTLNGTAASTNGDDIRPDYYSGLDDGSSDEDGSGSDLSDGEEMEGDELDDIPVTGFAVASNRRNADFHELFPTVPEGDYLIEDYGCALQREILIQGRIYISENHICFHANIFGWITDLSIPIYEITSLEKKMTAFVIPNAIQMTTRQAKYTFASFLSRDTTFDVIYNIWRLARPEDGASFVSSGRGSLDGPVQGGGIAGAGGTAVGAAVGVAAVPGAKAPAVVRKATQCTCGKEGKHYTETAMDVCIPGSPEKIYNLMFASGFIKEFMSENQKLLDIQISDWAPVTPGSKLLTRNMSYIKPLSGSLGPKQTKCEIRDEMVFCDFDEYVSMVTTTRTPDVPSGGVFSVKTRTCIMWANPVSSRVLITTQVEWTGRSFIKGIIERSAIDGQKVYHGDLEKAMRGYIQEHQTEFLPEGVEATAVTLTEVMEAAEAAAGPVDGASTEKHPTPEELRQREKERNARGLQWAWDTFDGAYQVAKRSTKGALELVHDAWDQSTSTTILWFVIVTLVFSNIWTLMRMGSGRDEVTRKLESRKVEEREKWVQSIVTALWDELAAGKNEAAILADRVLHPGQDHSSATPSTSSILDIAVSSTSETPLPSPSEAVGGQPGSLGWKEEVQQLHATLDVVEKRVKAIRESLAGFEQLNALD